jgi:hypothetical protein
MSKFSRTEETALVSMAISMVLGLLPEQREVTELKHINKT